MFMKKTLMVFGFISGFITGSAQVDVFNQYPVYDGDDLGLSYSEEQSFFRIWAPTARHAQLLIYDLGEGGNILHTVRMHKSVRGTWVATLRGNQKYKFYTFRIQVEDKNAPGGTKWLNEVTDPYAKAVGVNGKRAVILDLKETNPPGWNTDKSPAFGPSSGRKMGGEPTDAIIYELHVRDASIALNSGIKQKGKFLGLTERDTKNDEGLSTGLDHLRDLGVTHIHLLPSYDLNSIDESKLNQPQYNWGYDPLNYNTPEGSYSTDPYDGHKRIREFKRLVKALHDNGLRVVMDVVYNHTALTETSNFNQLVPGYYYRHTADGKFSNATACGNETASERTMMRKFILESMKYWMEEYHIDGFRIDLMGVHDIETMNLVSRELHSIKPDILLYGEGWTAGTSPLPDSLRALKHNANKLDRIAVFSDDIRDGIKGHVFKHEDAGFVSGKKGMEESIKFGVVASCFHPQVDYSKVNYSKAPYALQPWHTVTYAECHDNHVLWDKLSISAKNASEAARKEMHKLALSIVLTSQGIAFLHAGTEFLRTKQGVENSFESPDSINMIDWSLKTKNRDVFEYVRDLVTLRKAHPAFRMKTAKEIVDNIQFAETLPDGIVAYTIDGEAVGDRWKNIFIAFNGAALEQSIDLPVGAWQSQIINNAFSKQSNLQGKLRIAPHSCIVLYQL
jgi:pullulanase